MVFFIYRERNIQNIPLPLIPITPHLILLCKINNVFELKRNIRKTVLETKCNNKQKCCMSRSACVCILMLNVYKCNCVQYNSKKLHSIMDYGYSV